MNSINTLQDFLTALDSGELDTLAVTYAGTDCETLVVEYAQPEPPDRLGAVLKLSGGLNWDTENIDGDKS